MTEYIVIPKAEYELRKWEIPFTWLELESLLENKVALIKFLSKTKLSYNIELMKWTYKWEEHKVYRSMETIDEIVKSIEDSDKTFNKLKEEEESKKEKSKK